MVVGAQAGRLLGRQRERAVLERLLDTARDGHGAVLVVHGEPGVGKTALLEYAVEAGDGVSRRPDRGRRGGDGARLRGAATALLADPRAHRASSRSSARRARRRVRAERRDRRRARFSSGSRFSACSPKPPSSSRSCASSTTRSGSTAHRPGRSRSWLAACWRSGSRWCSRRVTWATALAGFPELRVDPLGRRDARALLESVLRRGWTSPCSSGSSPRPAGTRSRCWSSRAG